MADKAFPTSQWTEAGATRIAPRVSRTRPAFSGCSPTTAKIADVSRSPFPQRRQTQSNQVRTERISIDKSVRGQESFSPQKSFGGNFNYNFPHRFPHITQPFAAKSVRFARMSSSRQRKRKYQVTRAELDFARRSCNSLLHAVKTTGKFPKLDVTGSVPVSRSINPAKIEYTDQRGCP